MEFRVTIYTEISCFLFFCSFQPCMEAFLLSSSLRDVTRSTVGSLPVTCPAGDTQVCWPAPGNSPLLHSAHCSMGEWLIFSNFPWTVKCSCSIIWPKQVETIAIVMQQYWGGFIGCTVHDLNAEFSLSICSHVGSDHQNILSLIAGIRSPCMIIKKSH